MITLKYLWLAGVWGMFVSPLVAARQITKLHNISLFCTVTSCFVYNL